MKFKLSGSQLIVTREPGDKKIYGGGQGRWGDPESRFLYHVQKALNIPEIYIEGCRNHPLDNPSLKFLKKRMWKDGHLVSDTQQYLRSRKPVKKDDGSNVYLSLYNDHWAISDLSTDFNEGEACLRICLCTIFTPDLAKQRRR